MGIVGRDGGYTKLKGDNVILVPTVNKKKHNTIRRRFSGCYLAFNSKSSLTSIK